MSVEALSPTDFVRHPTFGVGRVEFDKGVTVLVRFPDGIQDCEKASLKLVRTPLQALRAPEWHPPIDVITRIQAEAIRSVNDTWGVFSRSRIQLLPHQLWVCRRVIETWPTRWLVADDVGLGKTIEAGLILWPLISRGTVRRLLILCPAALVGQWQERLRSMFDIRVAQYNTEVDTPRSDFWGTHNQVVASLQTLRADNRDRHQRMLDAPDWDLLLVDEAHHLNADEEAGPTLGYRFVQRLVQARKVRSMVFFTGTPHRGKEYGFLALLRLLRPDLFDQNQPLAPQLPHLSQVMIRNNKQNVTDLRGARLFQQPAVSPEEYSYSPAEAHFYETLTEFILSGKAYASSLGDNDGRAVMLVLTALQKLASSSVAAVRRALRRRLERIAGTERELVDLERRQRTLRDAISAYGEHERLGEGDEASRLDEEISTLSETLRLVQDEAPRLRELIDAAAAVTEETKIERILEVVEDRFRGRSVLFFTEYKATQSLLMTALIRRHGKDCVTFINGDNRAEGVLDPTGGPMTFTEGRESAARRFNDGAVRFLVSTEAAGEGIDLQESCHSLIHVDLPWNPMRLHQRVGRLNRYGQKHKVEVVTLRNPDTVEAQVWDKLNQKIRNIQLALSQVMEEPEDLMQLVLGMTSPTLLREVFTGALDARRAGGEALSHWFDASTRRFGEQSVLDAVKDLVGHSARFDFQEVADEIPKADLPQLLPFMLGILVLNHRRPQVDESGLSFTTPDAWRQEIGIEPAYDRLVFDRQRKDSEREPRVLGVGHKLVDLALRQASASDASVATLPMGSLEKPLVVFRVSDRLTGHDGPVRSVVMAVEGGASNDGATALLRDWELLLVLNAAIETSAGKRLAPSRPPDEPAGVEQTAAQAETYLREHLAEMRLPFRMPEADLLAILWPAETRT